MVNKEPSAEELLHEDIGAFFADPYGWVMYAFPWGEPGTQLEHYDGPDEWQKEALIDWGNAIKANSFDGVNPVDAYLYAVASGHGIGKAHPVDLIIDTPKGRRRWGDLRSGDLVFGANGEPVKIINRKDYRGIEMYRVTFDDGSYTDVSSGHLWNVKGRQERRKQSEQWRTMETIQLIHEGVKRSNGKAMARQWEVPVQGEAHFPHATQEVDPYVAGLWIGDGSKGTSRITKPYKEIHVRLFERGINFTVQKDGVINISGKRFTGEVFSLNSYDRFIPDEYKFASVAQRMALFEGLCDSDGEVNSSGSIGYSTTSERLAQDIIWLARSLGCKAMMQSAVKKAGYRNDSGDYVECRDCFRVTINAPFNPFSVNHKRSAHKTSEARYLKRWIDSIELIGKDDGMCITVDASDGLYLANDFIVTHNSAFSSWIILFIMSTRPYSRGVVTANTSDQLRTKTWGELAKWKSLCICGHWFEYNNGKGNMNIYHPAHKDTWRVDAQVCREENSESFAGLHAANSSPWYLFDEASAVPDKIWEVSEGGLTDGEPFHFVFGNPTRNTGRFRECWRKFKHRWHTKQVDSRSARMTNKKKIEEWRKDYGEDSDFFKVRVKGVFPAAGSMQFIGQDLVDAGLGVVLTERDVHHAPVIIGVDPAYTGEDEFVIYKRQGLNCKLMFKADRTDDDVRMAKIIADMEDKYQADAVHIDFGYGTGIVSVGRAWGRQWKLVPFGGKSTDPQMLNKRGEMWNSIKTWLKEGGQVDSQELADELVIPEFRVKLDGKVVLESKEEIKKRVGISPNRADALALTFAFPVMKKKRGFGAKDTTKAKADYDPFEDG